MNARLNNLLAELRRCPLTTVDDVKDLVCCAAARVADFDKATLGCDFSLVVDLLDQAHDAADEAVAQSVDPAEAAREVEMVRRAA
jgi:hypothetical protein